MPTNKPRFARPTFLMCPPRFFDVQYVINPWMESNLHAASYPLALEQWKCLYNALGEHADILQVEPQPALPDMVFTANAGLASGNADGTAVLSRFRCAERQGEEKHFRAWFEVEGFTIHEVPEMPKTSKQTSFEGEGDALFTPDGTRLWAGHGWRTDLESHAFLRELWPGVEVCSLHLVDPRFYHLDTCFAPLASGDLLYYPAAFDEPSCAAIEAFYPAEKRIAVEEPDALCFACNVVSIGDTVLLNAISPSLCSRLESRGLKVKQVQLSEFLKAGGAAKCLCLRLSEPTIFNPTKAFNN